MWGFHIVKEPQPCSCAYAAFPEISEKVVNQQPDSFLNSNDKQDVFQSVLNTGSALAKVVSDLLLASLSGFVSVFALPDLNVTLMTMISY